MNQDVWDEILKTAKESHSKQSWITLFERFHEEIIHPVHSKNIHELYRILHNDPQCLQYAPSLWNTLIEACLSVWDLELGKEISNFTQKIASTKTMIPAAKVYLESGHPVIARKIANRSLRFINTSHHERTQLEMIICRSYVEEGRRPMAIRLLNKMTSIVKTSELPDNDKALFLVDMARINFFLGRYPQAGELFHASYEIYRNQSNWAEAARSIYNSASSFFNAGGKLQEKSFPLVEECRKISEANELFGPLSHVEAFYGHEDYWHGNFSGARDHYRKALKYLPSTDKSFRTLHVLSMLAIIYLRTGQFDLAFNFGVKTLKLADSDNSERFRSRYHSLKAELKWEEGNLEESQNFLRECVAPIISNGVNTLEELSTLGRYLRQCAYLKEKGVPSSLKISDQLRKNIGDWIEYLYSLGLYQLGENNLKEASTTIEQSLQKSKSYGDRYHYSLSLLSKIHCCFLMNSIDEIPDLLNEFEVAIARLVETPIRIHTYFIAAGLAYRSGNFSACKQQLQAALKLPRIAFTESFVLKCWIDSIDGHAVRIHSQLHESLLAYWTRIYFNPKLIALSKDSYLVSDQYQVDLNHHPSLSELMEFLLEKNKFSATPADIQEQVWKQSLAQLGWQQKIRNSIHRLRMLFSYTLAPLVIHDENVRLFQRGIEIQAIKRATNSPTDEILRLLKEGPMSSQLLANRIKMSMATTKRHLKKLTDEEKITMMKFGRNVIYQNIPGSAGTISKI